MRINCMHCIHRMRFKAKTSKLFKDVAIYDCPICEHTIAVSIPKEGEE